MKDSSLCFVLNEGKVLLQKKSQGLFGGGKWNGPGGKIEDGETPEESAIREMREETGLVVKELQNIGILNFSNKDEKPFVVHVFISNNFSGDVTKNEEGELRWFDVESVPFDEMWEDDKYWFPNIISKKKFVGEFIFAQNFDKLIYHKVENI